VSTAAVLEYASSLGEVQLAALISDLLDLQARQSARWAADRRTVVEHQVGV